MWVRLILKSFATTGEGRLADWKKMKEFGPCWEFDEDEGIAFSCEYKLAEWEPDDIDWFTQEISKFEKFDWITPGISTKRTVELLIAKA